MMYKTIVVDDEKMIKRSISALIQSHSTGFTIVGEAKDGEEAFQLNEETAPHLIITDIRMPKMNGLSFIQKVKETNSKAKFIIISGYDKFEYAQTALRCGVVDFLLKPLKPDQFLQSLEKVREELEKEQEGAKSRSKWIWMVKSSAEQLAERVWLLEEKDSEAIIEDFHKEVFSHVDSPLLKNLYLDLLAHLKGELIKQNDSLTSFDAFNESEFSNEGEQMKLEVNNLCSRIMEEIKAARNIGHRNSILTAVKYIDTHFREESLSLQEVAGTIQMSPSYFSMEFKAEMGISYKQYITKLRINKAKELLNNPIYKTYEIAHSIGYGDYPHFTKTFKKYIGITPTQYRKRIGNS
ncbi:response regulator [Halobacillus salinarum]|uniref:Response regulator n=1 Tax=Halobacillus salinarum TaxID=2932257 RepID=A0ABY4EHF8_9BACI|nr:response regulator [Halobacillus salinarum]UOQ43899.1 response regulator [Halobacillus salinarum]